MHVCLINTLTEHVANYQKMYRTLLSSFSKNLTITRGLRTASAPLLAEKSINRVQILGRVGGDPRVFVQDEQRQLVFFNVVTNEVIKRTLDDGTIEETSKPTWHQFVVRRPGLRDYVASTLVKGSRVLCAGFLQNRVTTAPDGTERKSTNIILNELVVVDDYRRRTPKNEFDDPNEEQHVESLEQ